MLVLIGDSQNLKALSVISEHIKLLCVMKKVPFLNLNCTIEQLGSFIEQKTIAIAFSVTISKFISLEN
jgi:hypothetical protein